MRAVLHILQLHSGALSTSTRKPFDHAVPVMLRFKAHQECPTRVALRSSHRAGGLQMPNLRLHRVTTKVLGPPHPNARATIRKATSMRQVRQTIHLERRLAIPPDEPPARIRAQRLQLQYLPTQVPLSGIFVVAQEDRAWQ